MSKKAARKATEDNTSSNGELLDNPDTRPSDGAKRTKNQDVEKWLNAAYDFRYNTIKQKPEYKKKPATVAHYSPLDKYTLLSIKRELDAAGFSISKDGLMDILCSSYSPAVNPVKDYFKNAFPWDETTDHIAELCATLKAKNPADWQTYFKKWIVGVVANVFIDEKCANHVMLVLTGGQGKYKTTWLDNLCPKSLTSYLFTGKLNLESKDTLTYLAEYFLINIDDQLKQLHKKDENDLKNLITAPNVKYRRPYDPIITEYPHMASFMGSVNGNEFLNDPTGSRRFLPFEVESIDIKAAQEVVMEKVWSQAYHLFRHGYRYWFIDEEIDELNRRNAEFSMISAEEELLQYYFSPDKPTSGTYNDLKFYPTAVIKSRLETLTHSKLSDKKLGEALNKLNFKKKQKKIDGKQNWGWTVYEKSQDEISAQAFDGTNKLGLTVEEATGPTQTQIFN